MFDKLWFSKHQKLLLGLLNSEAGRFLLKIKDKEIIFKVHPNAIHQTDGETFKGLFWTANQVEKLLVPILTKIEIANDYQKIKNPYEAFLHFSGLEPKFNKYPHIFLDSATASPDSSEGWIQVQDNDWATARAATTGTLDQTTDTFRFSSGFSTPTYTLRRGFTAFDVTSIDDTATVTAVTYRSQSLQNTGNTAYLNQGTQSDTLAAGDFDLVTTTNYATYAGDDAWTNRTTSLNATAVTDVQSVIDSGKFKMCKRDDHDNNNSAPGDATNEGSGWRNQTWATVGERPLLTVTYSLPSSAFFAIL